MLLSKNGTQIANKIGDIRPIGILPTIWKAVEKAVKTS